MHIVCTWLPSNDGKVQSFSIRSAIFRSSCEFKPNTSYDGLHVAADVCTLVRLHYEAMLVANANFRVSVDHTSLLQLDNTLRHDQLLVAIPCRNESACSGLQLH